MMNAWGFFAALAWPAAVVACVWLLRAEVRSLLSRLSHVKSPIGDAIFRDDIADALKATNPTSADPAESQREQRTAETTAISEALANLSPGAAILDAWGGVERSLRALAEASGMPVAMTGAAIQVQRALRSRGALSETADYLLNQMRPIRNSVAHGQDDFSSDFATAFTLTANRTISLLEADRMKVQQQHAAQP